MQAFAEAVDKVRTAYEADEDDRALGLARALVPVALALDAESDVAWELAELLVLLQDTQDGLELAARQAELGSQDSSLVRQAGILTLANRKEKAAEVLQKAAAERGASLAFVSGLVELALAGLGWTILDDLEITDTGVLQMLEGMRRRASGFDLADLDPRRLAYIIARVVVMGASEDEGDRVEPYWFMNADEFETAWILRRLIAWMRDESVRPTSVRAADPTALPVALALAIRLGVQFRTEPPDAPGGVRVFTTLRTLAEAGAAHPNDRLTLSLGVSEAPGWKEMLTPSLVDVAAVMAPLDVSWRGGDQQARWEPGSSESREIGSEVVAASVQTIAAAILEEEARLPEDTALPQILQFYRTHRERVRTCPTE